jgi:hypothetical protein
VEYADCDVPVQTRWTELRQCICTMQDVPVALGSTGKTIKSKANDRVFVYYRLVPLLMHTTCVACSGDTGLVHIDGYPNVSLQKYIHLDWVQRPWGAGHPGHANGRFPVRRQAGQDAAQEGGREVRSNHPLAPYLCACDRK